MVLLKENSLRNEIKQRRIVRKNGGMFHIIWFAYVMIFRYNTNNYTNIIISKNKNGFQCVIHTFDREEKSKLIKEWSDVEIVLSWKGTCFMKIYSCLSFICYVKCLFLAIFSISNIHSYFHFCRCNNFIILKVFGVYEPLKLLHVFH